MSISGKTPAVSSIASITLKTEKTVLSSNSIKEFYPQITEEILEEATSFTKSLIDFDDHKIRTIKHCRKSLLFHSNVAWKKETTASCFHVTMDSYDGAELCKLIGTLILSKLGNIDKKNTDKSLYLRWVSSSKERECLQIK